MSSSNPSAEPALQPSTPFGQFIKHNLHQEMFCETNNRFTVKEVLTQQEKTQGKRVVVETALITEIDKKRRKVPGCDKEFDELALMYQKELVEAKEVDLQDISDKADDYFRFHMEEMKKEMDEKICSMKKECEDMIRSFNKEFEIKISAIKQHCDEMIRTNKQEFDEMIRSMKKECDEMIRTNKQEIDKKINVLEHMQQNHANELQELKSDMGRMKEELHTVEGWCGCFYLGAGRLSSLRHGKIVSDLLQKDFDNVLPSVLGTKPNALDVSQCFQINVCTENNADEVRGNVLNELKTRLAPLRDHLIKRKE
ncbi:hypothetical protein C9374_009002 [Naegleria lovaniensis]|uniref:Uncharacterized protein n=1 Tax=Naegleria lovaniensis TaxID=51637 RepID=A0AA88GEC9_NAELO|nr:uncharacterized protein C9374_009002 [Naegleria lovaniensis]KAG2377917.1 hypothetical protein C9374_009002 [Naegleria lovaniensis]